MTPPPSSSIAIQQHEKENLISMPNGFKLNGSIGGSKDGWWGVGVAKPPLTFKT